MPDCLFPPEREAVCVVTDTYVQTAKKGPNAPLASTATERGKGGGWRRAIKRGFIEIASPQPNPPTYEHVSTLSSLCHLKSLREGRGKFTNPVPDFV